MTGLLLTIGASRKLLYQIKEAGVYVRSGSGSLNDIWFWSSMYPQYTEARICRLFEVEVFFTGQGIGPISTKYRQKVLNRFIDCCTYITYRDVEGSEKLVSSVVGHADGQETVGDDAFDYPKEELDAETDSLFNGDNKVLVCQFRPTNYESTLSEDYWRGIAETLKGFVEDNPKHVVALVSFSNGRVSDLAISKKLNEYAEGKLTVLEKVYTPGEAKMLLSKAYAAVGQSYHFGVFALAENVPFIALHTNQYYEDKHLGLLGWYAMERFAISQGDITNLRNVLSDISIEREALSNKLRAANKSILHDINKVFNSISA